MVKSQVPRGATKKEKCKKCGRHFFAKLIGSSLRTTTECSSCNPKAYKEEKKK